MKLARTQEAGKVSPINHGYNGNPRLSKSGGTANARLVNFEVGQRVAVGFFDGCHRATRYQ